MPTIRTFTLVSALVAGCASTPPSQVRPTQPTAAEQRAASTFDARLSGFGYPYDVDMIEFEAQGHPLEMAFMDIRPATPNGVTVLLLHGKNFSGAYWHTTIEALSARGFRVLVPDQIGFGKSSKPAHYQYSFQALAAQTRALLTHLYDMIFTQPVVYEFKNVKSKMLLIIGQRDKTALGKNLVSPEIAETLGDYARLGKAAQAAFSDSRLVELKGIGHVPQYEAWPEYIEALQTFLEEDLTSANLLLRSCRGRIANFALHVAFGF